MVISVKYIVTVILFILPAIAIAERSRVIVTTDGEADDRCSMVRFLLCSNQFEVEGIINSTSQFHWPGGQGWNAFHPVTWVKDYIDLYSQVYDNLLLHDKNYPSPDYLLSQWKVGNIDGVGEMDLRSEGAVHIANVLLDDTDQRPVWLQAWGGCNTIARALKIIQEDHPDRMAEVAAKTRLFLIWEQDQTYQSYIRPNWEHFNIPTIISDQFDCMAYIWNKVLPEDIKTYFQTDFMSNIIEGHGPLCSAYEDNNGQFNAEGDTPAFLHCIDNGLKSTDSPGYGGWGGRYVKIRNNIWMDPKPASSYSHPKGRLDISNSWSKQLEHVTAPDKVRIRSDYFKPIWRWLGYVQRDFAVKADWCVKSFEEANHYPKLTVECDDNITARAGEEIKLSIKAVDPDGDSLVYHWWQYAEADTYTGNVDFPVSNKPDLSFRVPADIKSECTIHVICEVSDNGSPKLTSFHRFIINVLPALP